MVSNCASNATHLLLNLEAELVGQCAPPAFLAASGHAAAAQKA